MDFEQLYEIIFRIYTDCNVTEFPIDCFEVVRQMRLSNQTLFRTHPQEKRGVYARAPMPHRERHPVLSGSKHPGTDTFFSHARIGTRFSPDTR